MPKSGNCRHLREKITKVAVGLQPTATFLFVVYISNVLLSAPVKRDINDHNCERDQA